MVSKRIDRGGMDRRQRRWRWILVLGYMAGVFAASAIPGQALPRLSVHDKLIHAVEFGVLSLLLCRALRAQMPTFSASAIALLSVGLATGYGMADEGHQLLVAGRSTEVADLLADSGGALVGAFIWLKLGSRWPWLL